jgi:histidinol phosphatase-like enzyme (inositol monophosphatase family)
MTAIAQLLQAVADVASLAGDTAHGLYSRSIPVERKGDGSPVTHADRTAERAAREWIGKRFPEHGIVGEELGVTRPDAELRWFLDPIDGTQSYIRGVPLWGSLAAVARGEEILAGAIYCPAVDELVCAAVGEGCWCNGVRVRVSNVAHLRDAAVLTTDPRMSSHADRAAGWTTLASQAGIARGWSDCYGYLLVATGRAEAMLDPVMTPWDAAALLPVVSEAGGVITDWTGRVTAFGDGIVASNAALAPRIQEILGIPGRRA